MMREEQLAPEAYWIFRSADVVLPFSVWGYNEL